MYMVLQREGPQSAPGTMLTPGMFNVEHTATFSFLGYAQVLKQQHKFDLGGRGRYVLLCHTGQIHVPVQAHGVGRAQEQEKWTEG